MAISFEPFDLAQVLRSVPSMVSGQIPMVLKLSKQDWVAHSTSRNEPGLVTWRQTVAFPVKYKNNTCKADLEEKVYFSQMTKAVDYNDQSKKNSFPCFEKI